MVLRNRAFAVFVPWIISNALLFALAYLKRLTIIEVAAFMSEFVSVLALVFHRRVDIREGAIFRKYGVKMAAWSTIVTASLYLAITFRG